MNAGASLLVGLVFAPTAKFGRGDKLELLLCGRDAALYLLSRSVELLPHNCPFVTLVESLA